MSPAAERVTLVAAHAAADRADLARILAEAVQALAASGELDAAGLALVARVAPGLPLEEGCVTVVKR